MLLCIGALRCEATGEYAYETFFVLGFAFLGVQLVCIGEGKGRRDGLFHARFWVNGLWLDVLGVKLLLLLLNSAFSVMTVCNRSVKFKESRCVILNTDCQTL